MLKQKGGKKFRPHFSKVSYELKPIQQEAVWDGVLQPESQWAFPHEGSCKIAMRQCHEHYGLSLALSKKLKKWVLNNFAKEKIEEQLVSAVVGHNKNENEKLIIL